MTPDTGNDGDHQPLVATPSCARLRTLATLLLAERHNLWYSTHNPLESTYTHAFTTYKAWVVIAALVPFLWIW